MKYDQSLFLFVHSKNCKRNKFPGISDFEEHRHSRASIKHFCLLFCKGRQIKIAIKIIFPSAHASPAFVFPSSACTHIADEVSTSLVDGLFHWCTLKSRKNYLFYAFFRFRFECLCCGLQAEAESHNYCHFYGPQVECENKRKIRTIYDSNCVNVSFPTANGPFKSLQSRVSFYRPQPMDTKQETNIFENFSFHS